MQLKMTNATFSYPKGARTLFENLDAEFNGGTMSALWGPSGSGKSTLLDVVGGMRTLSQGQVELLSESGDRLVGQRHREACAWVLQSNITLSRRSVEDNVIIGALAHGMRTSDARAEAVRILAMFGLSDRKTEIVNRLSGGEQQRVTIARCLISPSDVILADEPTGNLDARNTELVAECLSVAAATGKIVVVATHDPRIADRCSQVIDLADQG